MSTSSERAYSRRRRTLLGAPLTLILALSAATSQAAGHGGEQFATDFEGRRTDTGETFEIGEAPTTATFGGQAFADSMNEPAFYHSGSFAWMVEGDSTGTIDFSRPAASITFFARAADANDDDSGGGGGPYGKGSSDDHASVITALDSEGSMLAERRIESESFQEVTFTGGVARIEVDNHGDGFNSIDDFGFTPQAMTDGMDGGMAVNKGHAGAWLNPQTSGQGIFIGIFSRGAEQPPGVFAAWFTFDADGGATKFAGQGQRWLVGQGSVSSEDPSMAEVTLFQTTGGQFNQPFPENQPPAEAVGSLTVQFEDCSAGHLSYELFAGSSDTQTLSGEMDIQRVTGDPSLCQELATGASAN